MLLSIYVIADALTRYSPKIIGKAPADAKINWVALLSDEAAFESPNILYVTGSPARALRLPEGYVCVCAEPGVAFTADESPAGCVIILGGRATEAEIVRLLRRSILMIPELDSVSTRCILEKDMQGFLNSCSGIIGNSMLIFCTDFKLLAHTDALPRAVRRLKDFLADSARSPSLSAPTDPDPASRNFVPPYSCV